MIATNQTLQDCIAQLPQKYVEEIMQCTCAATLNRRLKRTTDKNKKALLEARIENLNHLCAQWQ